MQATHDLSVNEYCVLHLLSEQEMEGRHYRMQAIAEAIVLSQSATTRLVNRLEDRDLVKRYLCPDDRRGIYADITETGIAVHAAAAPTHDEALEAALIEASAEPEYADLVKSLDELN